MKSLPLMALLAQPLRFFLVVSTIFALAIGGFSCGGGEEEQKETEDLTSVFEDAEDAISDLKRADKDKLFAEVLGKARDNLEEAEDADSEGKTKSAKSKLKRIKRDVAKALKSLAAVKAELKTVKKSQRTADAAKKKAQAAKADVNAPNEFKEATETYESAVSSAKSTSSSKLKAAGKRFRLAAELYDDALTTAKENNALKANIASEKEQMLKVKAQAKEKDAEKIAAQDWLNASRQEREAERLLTEGSFQRAFESFKYAADAYATCISQAAFESSGADELSLTEADLEPEPGSTDSSGGDAPVSDAAESESESPEADVAAVEESDEPPDIDFDDPDELLSNFSDKLANGEVRYDPGTGRIAIRYTSGDQLRKDVFFPGGRKVSRKFLKFKDPIVEMQNVGTIESPDDIAEPTSNEDIPFVFHGNTKGNFLIPIPLKGNVSIDWGMQLEVMDVGGAMNVLIFADQKRGVRSMGTNFGTLFSRNSSGIPKNYTRAIPKFYRRTPNGWFNKVKMMTSMRLAAENHPKTPEKQMLKVYYDTGENEDPINAVTITRGKSGYVGFEWNRVKFSVRSLIIRGELVKEDAVKLLKEKLRDAENQQDEDDGGDFEF